MKKLLLILLCLPILFNSCQEDENEPNSPFIGTWAGSWLGGNFAGGNWFCTISSNGDINGDVSSIDFDMAMDLNGTVTNSGNFTATIGTDSMGINFIGELSSNSGNGIWIGSFSEDGTTGTWSGTKQ